MGRGRTKGQVKPTTIVDTKMPEIQREVGLRKRTSATVTSVTDSSGVGCVARWQDTSFKFSKTRRVAGQRLVAAAHIQLR